MRSGHARLAQPAEAIMPRVIAEGPVFEYEVACGHCHWRIAFAAHEVTHVHDTDGWFASSIDCPHCSKAITVPRDRDKWQCCNR